MKRTFFSLILALVLAQAGFSQIAYRIIPRATNPASCNPLAGEVTYNTTDRGLYQCTATNTWTAVGTMNNSFTFAQGTLTANKPVMNATATWNNAAVAFTELFANVTDTASDAASLMLDLQIGGASVCKITKGGTVTVAASAGYTFNGRSKMYSGADGNLRITNNAGTGVGALILGPESTAGTAIIPNIVGGQTQGIIIYNGNGTPVSFAELGAATNGAIIYCDDCTIASPCAGGGTGAIAKRLNGAWVCN